MTRITKEEMEYYYYICIKLVSFFLTKKKTQLLRAISKFSTLKK
jgi:hypothetical protein